MSCMEYGDWVCPFASGIQCRHVIAGTVCTEYTVGNIEYKRHGKLEL